jgi:hypothetical protein
MLLAPPTNACSKYFQTVIHGTNPNIWYYIFWAKIIVTRYKLLLLLLLNSYYSYTSGPHSEKNKHATSSARIFRWLYKNNINNIINDVSHNITCYYVDISTIPIMSFGCFLVWFDCQLAQRFLHVERGRTVSALILHENGMLRFQSWIGKEQCMTHSLNDDLKWRRYSLN